LPLLFLLAVAQGPEVRPQHDLTNYLTVAAAYGSPNHAAALREIRQWQPREITAAVADLRRQASRLRSVSTSPDDIDFHAVEAAILMHAEAGLLSLQALSLVEAEIHLGASVTLYQWSREAAAETRQWAEARRRAFKKRFGQGPPTPGLEIRQRIDRRDFYVALAAAALAIGFPPTAHPFAEKARQAAPLDPEVQLVSGCVAESLAEEQRLRHLESEAAQLRDEADRALRDALALDPSLQEARLRLGRLLLVQGRLNEAELPLEEVEARASDARQRYLARLFLGRLAERRGRHDEAGAFYRRALEGWPDSQTARLALAWALERSSGPAAARPLVAASLAASQRLDRAADPWWLYPFGPPGLAKAALDRVWTKALDR
jgi:tetratricopeptide (TPR) repeat protein